MLFWSVLLFFFFQQYVISVGIITENSMVPTLPEGNTYLVNKYIYHFTRPQRGDIVVLRPHRYATDRYVKRVIAIEGDILLIQSGTVIVNGKPLIEPYARGPTYPNVGPLVIEKGRCFVLGDNRLESLDSRRFGTVPVENIEGKIRPDRWFAWH